MIIKTISEISVKTDSFLRDWFIWRHKFGEGIVPCRPSHFTLSLYDNNGQPRIEVTVYGNDLEYEYVHTHTSMDLTPTRYKNGKLKMQLVDKERNKVRPSKAEPRFLMQIALRCIVYDNAIAWALEPCSALGHGAVMKTHKRDVGQGVVRTAYSLDLSALPCFGAEFFNSIMGSDQLYDFKLSCLYSILRRESPSIKELEEFICLTKRKKVMCPKCLGEGFVNGTDISCTECKGMGEV